MKCPNCGFKKYMIINNLLNQNFSCPKCGDGISYPEKFIFNMFEQLGIDFKYQYSPEWVKPKKYDFYFKLNNLGVIVETHGIHHYEISGFTKIGGLNLEEEQGNDRLKKEIAMHNGIKKENYIIIDCRKSKLEWIKNSVIHSKLNELFDLSKINWLECHEATITSKIKTTCDLYNKGMEVKEIMEALKICYSTVYKYLKKGKKLNWIL